MSSGNLFFKFENSFSSLGNSFFSKTLPTQVVSPSIVKLNYKLADELGLKIEKSNSDKLAKYFSGNQLAKDSKPLSMVYAGHQFGHFVPQLGDGRAILLGEVIDKYNLRRDIQLKGSGITPYSRQGDGKATLGSVIREYIISEAMNALGIPTTRSLSIVTTGEPVYREKVLPGAILTRVAFGHIRTGTFQYFAARGDFKAVSSLFEYAVKRHYPELLKNKNPYLSFLEIIAEKYAELVAKWMQIGFIHGVMNTDNMTITCETIDYGPCAFMDKFDKNKVFSSIDQLGRYSYGNQPFIAQWNLARLAETLLPLIDKSSKNAVKLATKVIESFSEHFKNYWLTGMRSKIGLFNEEHEDKDLIESLLEIMHENKTDFTIAFRILSHAAIDKDKDKNKKLRKLFNNSIDFDNWFFKWRDRISREEKNRNEIFNLMKSVNPSIIPRNHLVEEAISAAELEGDYSFLKNLLNALSNPFDEIAKYRKYVNPPKPEEEVLKTFCGT